MQILDTVRTTIRGIIKELAILIDGVSNGLIRPNHVTTFSILGHVVIMLAIYEHRFTEAALLLVVFGLMDTLDGELARVQKSGTDFGALYDAVSDRIKEAMIFIAFAAYFSELEQTGNVVWAVGALAASIIVSYTKGKLETLVAARSDKPDATKLNKQLAHGVFRYEVRMTIIVIALLTQRPIAAVVAVAFGAGFTILERLILAKRLLGKPDATI